MASQKQVSDKDDTIAFRGKGKPHDKPHGANHGTNHGKGQGKGPGKGSGKTRDRTRDRSRDRAREPATQIDGLAARLVAIEALIAVTERERILDDALMQAREKSRFGDLSARDAGLARAIVTVALRHRRRIDALLAQCLDAARDDTLAPATRRRRDAILHVGLAQLLFMDVAAHAALSLSVESARAFRETRPLDRLVNAVMRKVQRGMDDGSFRPVLDAVAHDLPDWLVARWVAHYGDEAATRLAVSARQPANLDLSLHARALQPEGLAVMLGDEAAMDNPDDHAASAGSKIAARLGGVLTPTGSIRLAPKGQDDEGDGDDALNQGAIATWPGYPEGLWWVQDAAARLPALLLGDVQGLKVADLCAAPGGKTAQLASRGAQVVAVDRSAKRLERLRANMDRLRLDVDVLTGDLVRMDAPSEPFDAVLLDAPCSATGTLRRHPDLAWNKSEDQIAALAALQSGLLDAAWGWVRPGGRLVYCVCSLEPEEGEDQLRAFLTRHEDATLLPVDAATDIIPPALIQDDGSVRTGPDGMPGLAEDAPVWQANLDGFYMVCLRKRG